MLTSAPSAPSVPAWARAMFSPETLLATDRRFQPLLFEDLDDDAQQAVAGDLCDDDVTHEWSEDDVVQLHWRLLCELRQLADPQTPLAEKIDTLRWVFTSPDKDAQPFSFCNCLRVVGLSPLSPTAYFGRVDIEEVRDWIRSRLRVWLGDTIARYPQWVRDKILDHPSWVEACLERNPQWLNEEVKRHAASAQADLFQQADALEVA